MGHVAATAPPLSSKGHTTPRLSTENSLCACRSLPHTSTQRSWTWKTFHFKEEDSKKNKKTYHFSYQTACKTTAPWEGYRHTHVRWNNTDAPFRPSPTYRWKNGDVHGAGKRWSQDANTDLDSQPMLFATSLHWLRFKELFERLLMAREGVHDTTSSKKPATLYKRYKLNQGTNVSTLKEWKKLKPQHQQCWVLCFFFFSYGFIFTNIF